MNVERAKVLGLSGGRLACPPAPADHRQHFPPAAEAAVRWVRRESLVLVGMLETFAVDDALRLLAATHKTGCLYVNGDRGEGYVWVERGALVAATAQRSKPSAAIDEVIFELLRFRNGSFTFPTEHAVPQDPDHLVDVEAALHSALGLLDEWRELEAVVASLDHRVALAPSLAASHVTIDAWSWSALAAIGAGTSVAQLAERLELGEIDVTRRVRDLIDAGVVAITPPAAGDPLAGRRHRRATGQVPAVVVPAPEPDPASS
jgi:Domain of unknown function (DUF4388)